MTKLMKQHLAWRGIAPENACLECGGTGKKTYGSTMTWLGGIGGQTTTVAVCDKCWGTGDVKKPGAELRKLYYDIKELKAEIKETETELFETKEELQNLQDEMTDKEEGA